VSAEITLALAMHQPALKTNLSEMGCDIVPGSADDYGSKFRSEIDLWSRIVKDNKTHAACALKRSGCLQPALKPAD
jgi:hypothetical protein